ncbi:MAG: DUF4329 domain-containing protein [Candidatus Electrothrix sp. GM3_4]|nr:DUF4329 domain-containing protein [Candidatus Electrothrix sp. GM3_4]
MSPLKQNGGAVETAYSYDPVGNRLTWESNDDLQTNTPFDGFYRSYEYNAGNQMLAVEYAANKPNKDYAYEYSYDENGNRVNRQLVDTHGPQYGVDYSFDPENRLVLAQDYQIVGGKKKSHRIDRAFTTLEYDGGGRKLVQHYDPKQGGNGVDKRDEYVFDGLDPVAEYDMLNGQRTDYYRGAGGHLALMHNYKGGTQGQMYWYHYNNKGDVAGLTKHNGNSHHNYRYDPYGAVIPENGNFTDPHNHYILTGKEFDENTGLVWFGARYYEPETGVWMGQDSYRGRLNEPMSLHRFGYVNNNPVNFWDLYGFKPGDLFDTPKEAANDFGKEYNDNSIRKNVEYASTIYTVKDSDGATKYSYNIPDRGNNEETTCNQKLDDGQTAFSVVHTHGAYDPDPRFSNNKPTQADRNHLTSRYGKMHPNAGYVVTTNGSLVSFKKYTTIVENTNQPSDPNDPERKNDISPEINIVDDPIANKPWYEKFLEWLIPTAYSI